MPRAGFSNGRTAGFAAALLAITLLVFQPLVHAASMRGEPAPRSLWSTLCLAADEDTNERGATPVIGKGHTCCLGLPHAWTAAAPQVESTHAEPVGSCGPIILPRHHVPAAGIRDGPLQPRAPPFLA